LSGGLLLGKFDGGLVSLGDGAGLLNAVELDMAVGAEVGGDSTVGSVSSSAAVHSALHDDVVDNALVDVEALGLGVGSEVLEEFTHVGDGLLGPSTLGVLEGLALGVSANATGVLSERNNLFVFKHIAHVLDGSLDLHSLHGSGGLVSVLEVSSEVGNLGLSGYTEMRIRQKTVR